MCISPYNAERQRKGQNCYNCDFFRILHLSAGRIRRLLELEKNARYTSLSWKSWTLHSWFLFDLYYLAVWCDFTILPPFYFSGYIIQQKGNVRLDYPMRRKAPPFRAGDIRRVRRICASIWKRTFIFCFFLCYFLFCYIIQIWERLNIIRATISSIHASIMSFFAPNTVEKYWSTALTPDWRSWSCQLQRNPCRGHRNGNHAGSCISFAWRTPTVWDP